MSTRKQHRKQKAKNLANKQTYEEICNERPSWADDEKQEIEYKNWLVNFKAEVKAAQAKRDSIKHNYI